MCMWQSQAPSGALSFGGSVPAEFDTCWPRLSRPIAGAVAAIAIIEALLMKVRRAIMLIFLCPKTRTKDGAPGARPSRLSVSGATYSDIISPQGGDHEKIHHFPRRARLRNGIARFFRYLAGARARVDVAAAGPRADASCEYRSPPDGALQDDDERRARPRGDDPPDRARSWKRQRPAPPPRQPHLRLRARRQLRSESRRRSTAKARAGRNVLRATRRAARRFAQRQLDPARQVSGHSGLRSDPTADGTRVRDSMQVFPTCSARPLRAALKPG